MAILALTAPCLDRAFVAPRATEPERAGIVARTGAVVVDYVVVFLGMAALGFFLMMTDHFLWSLGWGPPDLSHLWWWGWFGRGAPGFIFPLTFLLGLAYFTFFEGRDGRTLGKQVFKLRVLRTNGAAPTPREAFIRNLVKAFPPLLLLDALFLLVFFHKEQQRASDRLAETIVVLER